MNLEEPYRSRAVPPGSARYWSWLFSATTVRAPLVGVYALLAEWRALMDPLTEPGVAQIKLAWWQDEMRRLCEGSPVHPISRFLARLPNAEASRFRPLVSAVEAAALQVAGAPLELGSDLEPHASALLGAPLALATRLGASGLAATGPGAWGLAAAHPIDEARLLACTAALAAGEYLARAVAEYRRDSRAGRVPFAIDELLAADIEDRDLNALSAPPHLQRYLDQLTARARGYFAAALQTLPRGDRTHARHLAVLAAMHLDRLTGRTSLTGKLRLRDLFSAWAAARGATAGR